MVPVTVRKRSDICGAEGGMFRYSPLPSMMVSCSAWIHRRDTGKPALARSMQMLWQHWARYVAQEVPCGFLKQLPGYSTWVMATRPPRWSRRALEIGISGEARAEVSLATPLSMEKQKRFGCSINRFQLNRARRNRRGGRGGMALGSRASWLRRSPRCALRPAHGPSFGRRPGRRSAWP